MHDLRVQGQILRRLILSITTMAVLTSCEQNAAPGDVSASLGGVKSVESAGVQLTAPATSLVFPPQIVGQVPTPQLLQVVASGSSSVFVASVEVEGAEFSLASEMPTGEAIPPVAGTTIAAKGASSIQVQFLPTTEGVKQGSVHILYGSTEANAQQQLDITLEGSGVLIAGNLISMTPANISFGTSILGVLSASKELVVVNGGNNPSFLGAITPEESSPFSVDWTDCPSGETSLSAGASCKVRMGFQPTEAGNFAGTVKLSYGKSSAEHLLSATAIVSGSALTEGAAAAAALSLSGAKNDFGTAKKSVKSPTKLCLP
jgi:hypothetical protein